jgi:para-aminobenzoate synthetase/4-amino-4-deoxychorismate lyase
VAIRTAVIDRESGEAAYGVGSGIVADSVAEAEYAECLLKAKVLDETPFRLLETMLYTPAEGLALLDLHLRRLLASAGHFGGRVEGEAIVTALRERTSGLSGPTRVRLLVDLDGRIEVQTAPLPVASDAPLRVARAKAPVDETSPWLFHKTTRREVYESAAAAHPGLDDVILWNRRGEATEGTKHNLVVDLADGLVTPPVSCGLLAGTFRARLLENGEVREAVVPIAALATARALFLVNSVAGWRKAVLVEEER